MVPAGKVVSREPIHLQGRERKEEHVGRTESTADHLRRCEHKLDTYASDTYAN